MRAKDFCFSFWLIFCFLDPDLGSDIFADPDQGSQNVADPSYPGS